MQLTLHPKQTEVFQSSARQILFGGAAGPGKSHLLRVVAIAWATAIPGLQVYLFRRAFPDLYRNHMEGPTGFPTLLGEWVEAKKVRINYSNHEISFVNGSNILLAHIQHDSDLMKIHGAEIHVALIDELTHFPKHHYAFIRSRVRMSGVKVPVPWHGRFPRIVTASNPGGIGHGWVRALFIDPVPPRVMWQAPPEEGGLTTQFIPALLDDNPSLLETDPDYEQRLAGLGNPELVRAMREGDWNIALGAFFADLWQEKVHVIPPFRIPQNWRIDRSHDWGESRPFATLWFAESNGEEVETPQGPQRWPKGTLFVIAEDYGWNGKPNEGIRLPARQIAQRVKEAERAMGYMVHPGPADLPAMQNGQSVEADMAQVGVRWEKPQKGPGSRVTGWSALRGRLAASLKQPMEEPGLFIFDTCRHVIRTLPVLPRDEKNLDDVATESDDHCADALRLRVAVRDMKMAVGRMRV